MKKEKCYSCGGKGTYSQMTGQYSGRGVVEYPNVKSHTCSACDGTGNKLTVKKYKASKYETDHSHFHCWNQEEPACGMSGVSHKQCCLCSKKSENNLIDPKNI